MPPSTAKPLAGRRIVVTRPVRQSEALRALIEKAGGEPLRYPTLDILPPPDPEAARSVLADLERFDIAIFVSPTAVQEALALRSGAWPERVLAAAVGPGTRAELERRGVRPVLAPVAGADSGALLAAPELAQVRGRSVLIVRGAGGREVLADTLVERGARVQYAECYRRAQSSTDLGPLAELWKRDAVHGVTVFSAGALENLLAGLPEGVRRLALDTPIFASHPRIAQKAAALGVAEVLVAGPSDDDMLRGLIAYFTRPASTKLQ